MNFSAFFEQLTGNPPYPYQERVADLLRAEKSVILRAPTGAGKTWAVIAPYLHARRYGPLIADRLIYALPLRALATNLWETVSAKAKSDGTSVSLQVGGQGDDPFFEADIVFTTIDQLLSSYLMMPVALSPRLDNLNAGALPGALLVIDEVHLLEPEVALGTVIEMMDRLNKVTRFVLMTATLSSPAVEWLADKLGAVVEQLSPEEVRNLPSQRGKQRSWHWHTHTLSADAVAGAYQGGRAIVLTNTVGRAQKIFADLKSARTRGSLPPQTELLCLHSRFFPNDRRAIEDELAPRFGPDAGPSDTILVTTQVIEAGIDISAEQLHTELAPMNALVQRAGRVARYPGRNVGTVTVYEVESALPYGDKALLQATREALAEAATEDEWIDLVHGANELSGLQARYANLHARRTSVNSAMDSGDRGQLSQLVRETSSVNVLVTSSPEAVRFDSGQWPATLSISPHSLWALAGQFDIRPSPLWTARKLVDKSEAESGPPKYEWDPVTKMAELQAQWMVALHPEVARYDAEAGLLLGQSGEDSPVEYLITPPRTRYQYWREDWLDHARRVVQQSRTHAPRYNVAVRRMSEWGEVERWVELVCALHDAGKLSVGWQQVAHAWQREKDGVAPTRALAHTTWRYGDRRVTFPHHAVEGALMVYPGVLREVTSQLGGEVGEAVTWAMLSAIARHHSPRAKEGTTFITEMEYMNELSAAAGVRIEHIPEAHGGILAEFTGRLLHFGDAYHCKSWVLYVLLTRRLRLADQAATASGSA